MPGSTLVVEDKVMRKLKLPAFDGAYILVNR